jgi:GH25 family lysozyme M1 (1,4-beta-N-acetylmuramidase)
MFNIIKNRADWDHDRLVIDLELHQFQDKRTITDRTKQFAYICKERTGRYPILYSRSYWMDYYALPKELTFMDVWLAQYLYPVPSGYTPEKRPPPNLPSYYTDWLVHQTGDHCEPIGSSVKKVMDYNRWNGGADVVAKYFNYKLTEQPEEPLTIESLDKRLKIIEEHLGIGR